MILENRFKWFIHKLSGKNRKERRKREVLRMLRRNRFIMKGLKPNFVQENVSQSQSFSIPTFFKPDSTSKCISKVEKKTTYIWGKSY